MKVFVPLLLVASLLCLLSWNVLNGISNLGWSSSMEQVLLFVLIVGGVKALLGLLFRIWEPNVRPIHKPRWKNYLGSWLTFWVFTLVLFAFLSIIQFLIASTLSLFGIGSYFDFYFSNISLLVLALLLLLLTWGMIWGKYRYSVENVILEFADLPANFDGIKIAQISDAHSGTWDSMKGVEKGIRLLQSQDADLIVFTGDLVNGDKEEIEPFIELFSSLSAPLGKYAILGNHDYYGQPREQEHRAAYYNDYFDKFKRMGWDLMLNDHRRIYKKDASIALVGVENWGQGRFFPKRGDLKKALSGVAEDDFTILLSHDPTHWDYHVKTDPHHIHLTLSGHTHAMQFGIHTSWLKWSPVSLRYKKWMGLYEEFGKYLYINRGFGCLGYPGRVGMYPEITVIELKKKIQ